MDMNTSHSAFARLLATEDIRVIHSRRAETASFDVVGRVLTLPIWKGMNKHLYDMLIGHEVAHALWTDTEIDEERQCLKACSDIDPDNPRNVMGILNIVEDARIERKIKEQYPGLRRDFAAGYRWLWDNDIFPIEEMGGVSNASLADRLNLHFKVGLFGLLNVPFSDEEMVWVDRLATTDSWEDVVEVSRDLYAVAKQEAAEGDLVPEEMSGAGGDGTGEDREPGNIRVLSQEAMDNSLDERFAKKSRKYAWGYNNTTMPTPDLDLIVMDRDEQERMFEDHAVSQCGEPRGSVRYNAIMTGYEEDRAKSRERFETWVNGETKTVNYLLKQFDLKKAADEHRRTMITKSGRLDTVRMINHRWSEDIFAKNHIVRDGKNHGFIMYLDWSGSMQNCILPTVKQAILLALFCQKAGIPVDLYAFSNASPRGWGWRSDGEDALQDQWNGKKQWDRSNATEGENATCEMMRLIHFVDASSNRRQMMDDLARMFYLAETQNWHYNPEKRANHECAMSAPRSLQLCGTPLEEAIVAAHWQVPAFQRRHGVQVMNVVVLTDGDGGGGGFSSQIYNPILKRTFGMRPEHENMKDLSPGNSLLISLKETTGCNLIGMYLASGPTVKHAHGWVKELETSQWSRTSDQEAVLSALNREYKKNGFIIADGPKSDYYDEAYIINANIDPEPDVELDDSNHAKLRSSFVKGMTQRSMSRTLTNRFVDRVAC